MTSAYTGTEDNPEVLAAPPLYFLAPVVLGWALEFGLPTNVLPSPERWLAGAILVAAGIALNVGGFQTQRRAGTDPLPAHASTRIVTHGLYAVSRNPMYLGMLLWATGLALMIDSWWILALLAPSLVALHFTVIAREERYLERKFGEDYVAYKARVRRWL